jgi:hypothetical protein
VLKHLNRDVELLVEKKFKKNKNLNTDILTKGNNIFTIENFIFFLKLNLFIDSTIYKIFAIYYT